MAYHHTTRTDLADRLRTATAPADTTGDLVPIQGMRRIRRWDEPQPSDPYPERPTPHPGVRQSDQPRHGSDWEFNNGLPVTEPVVRPTTPASGRVITTRPAKSGRHPLAATPSTSDRPRAPRLTWWAVAFSVVAQATVTAALQWGDAEPILAIAVSVAMLVCSLLLIGAEQMTGRCRR